MALNEHPGLMLRKIEDLKKWQKLQEEKMRLEQEAQRELLVAAQRRMYEEYSLEYSQGSCNGDSLHQTSLESFPRIDSPNDTPPPQEPRARAVRRPEQTGVLFDEVPVPSPHKDFNELLSEKLQQTAADRPREGAPSKIVKRPFLKKGQGLVKYQLNPERTKPPPKPTSAGKTSVNKISNLAIKKPTQSTINLPSNKNKGIANETQVPATWANVLSKGPNQHLVSEQVIPRPKTPDQRDWMPSSSEASPNKPVGANKLTKKELEDLRLFELLEQKAANSSFCSSSSTIIRLLERSHQSTPNKSSSRDGRLTLRDIQLSPLPRPPGRSVRFAQPDGYDFFTPADDSETSVDLDDPPLFIGRDADGQKTHAVLSPVEETSGFNDSEIWSDSGKPQAALNPVEGTSPFQDSQAWSDGCSTPTDDDQSDAGSEHAADRSEGRATPTPTTDQPQPGTEQTGPESPPSPTNQLVRVAVEGVAYKSDLLRRRLAELEAEIETFRRENAALGRARRAHDAETAEWARQRRDDERKLRERSEAAAAAIGAERAKLAADRRALEKCRRELKDRPTAAARAELAAAAQQVAALRGELAEKSARAAAAQARARDRVATLAAENARLKTQLGELRARHPPRRSLPDARTAAMHAVSRGISAAVGPSALLANRPAWGARNNVPPIARAKSVPDVRAKSPAPRSAVRTSKTEAAAAPKAGSGSRFQRAVRTDTRCLNGSRSESPSETESESDDAVDPAAMDRVEKLRRAVYETYYENVPGNEPKAPAIVQPVAEENADDDDVPDFLKAVAKRIDQHKAILKLDKEADSRCSSAGSNHSMPGPEFNASPQETPAAVADQIPRETPAAVGDRTPRETLRANGVREKLFADGRKEIWYPNGTVKKVSADRATTKLVFGNGDVKETVAGGGLVRYYYAETKTWHSTYKDGTELLEFPNGQTERRTPAGVSEISFPNGCVRVICEDGRDQWSMPDGSVVTTAADGETVARLPNGQREVHTAAHKRREYPDGTVKLVYPDGLQETRYAGGRVRLKDAAGNLVMDSADKPG